MFKKELNHDLYSSKKLLEKCFSYNFKVISFEGKISEDFSLYGTHIGFWFKCDVFKLNYFKLCIHCGMSFL